MSSSKAFCSSFHLVAFAALASCLINYARRLFFFLVSQAVLNQAPLLLRHRTETVTAALANTERLIPGLRYVCKDSLLLVSFRDDDAVT